MTMWSHCGCKEDIQRVPAVAVRPLGPRRMTETVYTCGGFLRCFTTGELVFSNVVLETRRSRSESDRAEGPTQLPHHGGVLENTLSKLRCRSSARTGPQLPFVCLLWDRGGPREVDVVVWVH